MLNNSQLFSLILNNIFSFPKDNLLDKYMTIFIQKKYPLKQSPMFYENIVGHHQLSFLIKMTTFD